MIIVFQKMPSFLPVLILTLWGFLAPSVCGGSCCECQPSLVIRDFVCKCSQQLPKFCEFPETSADSQSEGQWQTIKGEELRNYTDMEYLRANKTAIGDIGHLIVQQKALKTLKLSNVETRDPNWKWNELLDNLTMLSEWSMDRSTVTSPLFDNSEPFEPNDHLIAFSVTNSDLKSIKDDIMIGLNQLKVITLTNNCIVTLSRRWFAPNLTKLWSLDLSFNSIQSIPKDFFEGMTALKKLRFDNNSLKTLKYVWFAPIWDGLHEFWIDGNSIQCSPDLEWVPDVKHPMFFDQGNCYSHEEKRVRYFFDLAKMDQDITNMSSLLVDLNSIER